MSIDVSLLDFGTDPRVSAVLSSPLGAQENAVDDKTKPAAARFSGILIGTLCGIGAALGWAAGFVAAKHGSHSIAFSGPGWC
jgi:hypothetical protein